MSKRTSLNSADFSGIVSSKPKFWPSKDGNVDKSFCTFDMALVRNDEITYYAHFKIWGKKAKAFYDNVVKGMSIIIQNAMFTNENYISGDGSKIRRSCFEFSSWHYISSKAENDKIRDLAKKDSVEYDDYEVEPDMGDIDENSENSQSENVDDLLARNREKAKIAATSSAGKEEKKAFGISLKVPSFFNSSQKKEVKQEGFTEAELDFYVQQGYRREEVLALEQELLASEAGKIQLARYKDSIQKYLTGSGNSNTTVERSENVPCNDDVSKYEFTPEEIEAFVEQGYVREEVLKLEKQLLMSEEGRQQLILYKEHIRSQIEANNGFAYVQPEEVPFPMKG